MFRARPAQPRRSAEVHLLWRRFLSHPLVASITPTGWALIMGGGIAALVGWRGGWLEFRALAVMSAVVILIACLSVMRRREHAVVLSLHRPRVQAGEEALGSITVTAAGNKRAGSTTMEFRVGRANASFRVAPLVPGDEHEEIFAIPTRRRGIVKIGPVRSVQADPVGAISRQKLLTDELELYIHPQLRHVSSTAIGFLKDVEGVTTTNLSSSDVSFHALREYQPGDDRRAVHWRTTARTGKLMVRQFEETMRAHLVIMLSTVADHYSTEDDFELAVSVTASLAVSALRDERQVSIITSNGLMKFPNPLGLLDRLSGIELQEVGPDHRGLALQAIDISGVSVAAFVTGATPPPSLRAAQLTLHAGITPFAVRCDSSLQMARRRVGDLVVLDLAALDDLAAAVGSLA